MKFILGVVVFLLAVIIGAHLFLQRIGEDNGIEIILKKHAVDNTSTISSQSINTPSAILWGQNNNVKEGISFLEEDALITLTGTDYEELQEPGSEHKLTIDKNTFTRPEIIERKNTWVVRFKTKNKGIIE